MFCGERLASGLPDVCALVINNQFENIHLQIRSAAARKRSALSSRRIQWQFTQPKIVSHIIFARCPIICFSSEVVAVGELLGKAGLIHTNWCWLKQSFSVEQLNARMCAHDVKERARRLILNIFIY